MAENELMTVQDANDALIELDYDNVLALAERADKMVGALNKIMQAALKITNGKDWVLIGGTPYLQETGASKVARLFGISWKICDGYPMKELDKDGYPTYTYRMEFTMHGQTITAEGMRNAADEFFTGKNKKSVDEIDLADVKRAAYTNCLNRGIKGILPGLRNLDVSDLEAAGINIGKTKGYTFKEGSKGGNTGSAEESGLVCSNCGEKISQKVASYSEGKFGRRLCMNCQKAAAKGAIDVTPKEEKQPTRGGRRAQQAPEPEDYPPTPDDDHFPPADYYDDFGGEQ